ncbi:MAG: Rrf2 family transcriptional regulator [Pirellulaceae bacterium]
MISLTAEYSLRAVVFLAGHEIQVSRADIADATLVPADYLLKVLNGLDNAGIVESKRGPGGGYKLTRSADQISVLDVVRAVEELPRIEKCPLGLESHTRLCPLHKLLDDAAKIIEDSFRQVKISDLCSQKRVKNCCQFPISPN